MISKMIREMALMLLVPFLISKGPKREPTGNPLGSDLNAMNLTRISRNSKLLP